MLRFIEWPRFTEKLKLISITEESVKEVINEIEKDEDTVPDVDREGHTVNKESSEDSDSSSLEWNYKGRCYEDNNINKPKSLLTPLRFPRNSCWLFVIHYNYH